MGVDLGNQAPLRLGHFQQGQQAAAQLAQPAQPAQPAPPAPPAPGPDPYGRVHGYLAALGARAGPPGVPNFERPPGALEAPNQAGQQPRPIRGLRERDLQMLEGQGQREQQQGAGPQPPQAGSAGGDPFGIAGLGPAAARLDARQARMSRAHAAFAQATNGQNRAVAAKARDLLALSRVGLGNQYWAPQLAPGVGAHGQGQQVAQAGGPFNPQQSAAVQDPQAVPRQPVVHPVFGFPYPQFGPGFHFHNPPEGGGGVQ
jgi:hypothetical protein